MNFIILLQKWYKKNKRPLPWRETSNPYNIWISEIIFQQTRINQGFSYYVNFIQKFPDLQSLASASEDEVLQAWQGLGYYSRAHNLHFTAQHIYFVLKGIFPSTYSEILKLKGVGKYTAAAIASISFNEKIPAIDGNAFRVYSRIFNSDKDISKTSTFNYFFDLMKPIMPSHPGDFNQAIMDLGSSICTPSNPDCKNCPVNTECLAYKENNQNNLPVKSSLTKVKEQKIHYAFITHSNYFLLKKRDKISIWKGLYEFPQFESDFKNFDIIRTHTIKHKLSHRDLTISISEIHIKSKEFYDIANRLNAIILTKKQLPDYALPKPLEKFLSYT